MYGWWRNLFESHPLRNKKKKERSSQQKLYDAYEKKSVGVDLLGKPSRKYDNYAKHTPPPTSDEPIIPIGWDDHDCTQLHKKMGLG